MKPSLTNMLRRPIGIAISETNLTAMVPPAHGHSDRLVVREWELEPLVRTETDWPSLTAALIELRGVTSSPGRRLAIALLPPLVQLRRVELPKLRSDKLRLLVTRNAGRYFPGVRETQTVNAMMLANTTPAPYLAAAAPARVVDAITRAVRDASCEIATIVPAETAWAEAALQRWPALKQRAADVAVRLPDYVALLQLAKGKLSGTRRFLGDAVPDDVLAYTLDRPSQSAAAHAADADALELLPQMEYARRAHARQHSALRSVWVLAAVLVLAALGVLWRDHHQLDQIKAERAALRVSVGEVEGAQTDIASVTAPVGVLRRIETNAPLWSDVFADIAGNLPQTAYLVSFRAQNDSVAAEGYATHGAGVFENMDGASLIDNVRSAGPIRRETQSGAPAGTKPIDHFTMSARVMNAVPLYAGKGKTR